MVRHGIVEMEPPTGLMALHENRKLAEAILEAFVTRGRRHRQWYDTTAEERIENELRTRGRSFLDSWEKVVDKARAGAADRTYSGFDRAKAEGKAVMYTATDDPPDDLHEQRFVAPTSMRDVEPETHIWIRFAQLDERR